MSKTIKITLPSSQFKYLEELAKANDPEIGVTPEAIATNLLIQELGMLVLVANEVNLEQHYLDGEYDDNSENEW